jgi:hypothetical protein
MVLEVVEFLKKYDPVYDVAENNCQKLAKAVFDFI